MIFVPCQLRKKYLLFTALIKDSLTKVLILLTSVRYWGVELWRLRFRVRK